MHTSLQYIQFLQQLKHCNLLNFSSLQTYCTYNIVHCTAQSPKDTEDQMQALLCIRAEIRMATSSMTSVPKPLKFLREHFDDLEACYGGLATSSPSRKLLADVLSVLAMAMEDKTERKCLNYRLQGSQEKVSSFGHPYIR